MERTTIGLINDIPIEILMDIISRVDYKSIKLTIPLINRRFKDALDKLTNRSLYPLRLISKLDHTLFRDVPTPETLLITDPEDYRIHPALLQVRRLYVDTRTGPVQYYSKACSNWSVWSEHCTSPSVTVLHLLGETIDSRGFDIFNPSGVTVGDIVEGITRSFCSPRMVEKFPVIIHPTSSMDLPMVGFTDNSYSPHHTPCQIYGICVGIERIGTGIVSGKIHLKGRWENVVFHKPFKCPRNEAIYIYENRKNTPTSHSDMII